jgi:hypothetical protein
MFSKEQKTKISNEVEKLLLSFNHPEMPKEKPEFRLHIDGKEDWSWADIEPNHHYENIEPGINPHNEKVAQEMVS